MDRLTEHERRACEALIERQSAEQRAVLLSDLEMAAVESLNGDRSILRFHLPGYEREEGQNRLSPEGTVLDLDDASLEVVLYIDRNSRLMEFELIRYEQGDVIGPKWETFGVQSVYKLVPTTGLSAGMTVQFAEGVWPGEIGNGVAMTDEAFNIVEPHLAAVATGWTPEHRYGVFELAPEARQLLTTRLQRNAAELRLHGTAPPEAVLLDELATWLDARLDDSHQISVLGH